METPSRLAAKLAQYLSSVRDYAIGTLSSTLMWYGNIHWANWPVLKIWKDIHKGDRPSETELQAAFKTTNAKEIAKIIVQKGVLQLTDAERKEILAKKRAEISTLLFLDSG